MHRHLSLMKSRLRGFSLVEIMVGLAIGMLAVIVVMQVFALSEERKRTTTGAGDAQSSGILLFYQLKRDISLAGYGFSSKDAFNCPINWKIGGTAIATNIPLAPVTINPATTIIPAGDANTDRLLVVYGNGNGQPQGSTITEGASSTVLSGSVRGGFAVNDRVFAVPTGCASTLKLNQVTAANDTSVTVAESTAGSILYNMGQTPSILAYAIRGGQLTVCDYLVNDCGLDANKAKPSVWVPIADDIVSLRAQYGHDADPPADGIVSTYNQTTPTDGCGWARAVAVRLALVTRSAQYDKEEVTNAAPTWMGSADAPIDLTANTEWKHYRYKVLQSVVPIRNVTWMGGAEC